jgi:hypothetical protein
VTSKHENELAIKCTLQEQLTVAAGMPKPTSALKAIRACCSRQLTHRSNTAKCRTLPSAQGHADKSQLRIFAYVAVCRAQHKQHGLGASILYRQVGNTLVASKGLLQQHRHVIMALQVS